MTRRRYLGAAQAWHDGGRPRDLLLSGDLELLALRCWFQSDGAEREGRDQVVADFGDACEAAYEERFPTWWGMLLRERTHCETCGERYMHENLFICTHCLRLYCFHCIDKQQAPNGNWQHPCGGEVVG